MIERGHLFIGQPPLFKLQAGQDGEVPPERARPRAGAPAARHGRGLAPGAGGDGQREDRERGAPPAVRERCSSSTGASGTGSRSAATPAAWLEASRATGRSPGSGFPGKASAGDPAGPRAPRRRVHGAAETEDVVVAVGVIDGEERKLNLNLFGSGEYARLVEAPPDRAWTARRSPRRRGRRRARGALARGPLRTGVPLAEKG